MKFKLPALKAPAKKLVNHAATLIVLTTGLTGVYNFASARIDQSRNAVAMKSAQVCEAKLTQGTPCTLDEQKALLKREAIERRQWKSGVTAGGSILVMMAAF